MNKKKVLAVLAVVLCLSVLGDVTAAYFTAKDTAHNVITTGNVDIRIVEQQKVDDKLVPYPDGPIQGVMPGAEVSKIVTVRNTGSGDAWVRVHLDRSFTLSPDAPEKLPAGADPMLMELDVNTAAWEQDGEWYYYRTPLAVGAGTEPLFESVTFAPEMGNAYQGATADIVVSAQAVQVKNNPKPQGGTYADIPGWPTVK